MKPTHELIEVQLPDGTHAMTPQDLMDALAYANYKYNRQRAPEISPERWGTVFGWRVPHMEVRYQQELTCPKS